jgi:hypothetical protein
MDFLQQENTVPKVCTDCASFPCDLLILERKKFVEAWKDCGRTQPQPTLGAEEANYPPKTK